MRPARPLAAVAALLAALPGTAVAHEGCLLAGAPDRAGGGLAGLGLGVLLALHLLGAARCRAPRRQHVAFAAGWTVLALSTLTPLHELGEALFAAHMVQHLLLTLVVAPLLVLGAADRLAVAGLPGALRRRAARALRPFTASRPARAALIGTVAFALATWAWHVPALYELAVLHPSVHSAEHATMLGAALLFWHPLLRPAGRRLAPGIALLALFGTALHSALLGALLTLAPAPWFGVHAGLARFGLSALEDQQLAGAIMWAPAGIAFLLAAGVLAARAIEAPARRPLRGAGALVLAGVALAGCADAPRARVRHTTLVDGGSPEAGRHAVVAYGCVACHVIPGQATVHGRAGPSLAGFATRRYVAGSLPNEPDQLVQWLLNPPAEKPGTGMPVLGLTEREAIDIAAYLYTLR